jgi:peptidoglycan hydrolase CwlO-like protein
LINKFIGWFFSPSSKPIVEDIDAYSKLIELEDRIESLETENIELTNELYRMENSLDARIDILAERCRIDYDV